MTWENPQKASQVYSQVAEWTANQAKRESQRHLNTVDKGQKKVKGSTDDQYSILMKLSEPQRFNR